MKISLFLNMVKKHKRTILLTMLSLFSAVSILSVGPTYAYLKMESSASENTFSTVAQSVTPQIIENFSTGGTTKTNVKIAVGDTGGYSVYVRAVAVVTWKKGTDVLGTPPVAGTDYTISYGDGWTAGSDGYYYYSQPVASGGETGTFITSCRVTGAAPEEGYTLSVEILAQTIQAAGKTGNTPAAQDAWGHTFG